ncbi:MAG: MBL fold metallo-hydrolase [Gemmatimonadales bacterium]
MPDRPDPTSRRRFLAQTGSCAAHLALASAFLPPSLRHRWTARTMGRVVAAEPWGRIEEIGPGLWAMVSTPLSGDFTTVSNGAIIAGRSAVLVIEGLMQPKGATWLAEQARTLTGRWPTHVMVTHYHSDHINGVAGYFAEGARPAIWTTATTRDWALEKNQADEQRNELLKSVVSVDPATATTIDLGGRKVTLVPRTGHTRSDLTAVVEDPRVVFAGDLLWNGMFPNYVDAAPSTLARSVRSLESKGALYVPGHGPLARDPEVKRYRDMLDEVERAAKAARKQGLSAADGAKAYRLPESLGEWTLFNPRFIETAFGAWYRELDAK